MTRERYDDVMARVPVCDWRGVTRFAQDRANQHCDCDCTDSPLHDVSLLYFPGLGAARTRSHNKRQVARSAVPVAENS
jgi:hypothetical protein